MRPRFGSGMALSLLIATSHDGRILQTTSQLLMKTMTPMMSSREIMITGSAKNRESSSSCRWHLNRGRHLPTGCLLQCELRSVDSERSSDLVPSPRGACSAAIGNASKFEISPTQLYNDAQLFFAPLQLRFISLSSEPVN